MITGKMSYFCKACLVFLFFAYEAQAQGPSVEVSRGSTNKKPLQVRVTNITKVQGKVMLAVYDRQEDFLTDNVVTSAIAEVHGNEVIMNLDGLVLSHPYAISIYHDVNSNGKLDTNIMRIPTEPYGFSNNNLGVLPIPNYQKSAFILDEKLDSLEIVLR